MEKPTKNKIYPLTVDALGKGGEGVAHFGEMPVYIYDALPNEAAEVQIQNVKPTYAFGKIMNLTNPSKDRVAAPCPIAKACGGCQIQHMDYKAQLAHKENLVFTALDKKNLSITTKNPIIGMATPWHYRNKLQFAIQSSKEGQPTLGLYSQRNHRLVAVSECIIQHKLANTLLLKIQKWVNEANLSTYDESTKEGLLRHIVIRVSFKTNTAMVGMVINQQETEDLDWKNAFLNLFSDSPEVTCIFINFNQTEGNTVLSGPIQHWGKETFISETIGALEFKISPTAFFQVNPIQTEVLLQHIQKLGNWNGTETVWDLFCGTGSLGLSISPFVKKVIGIEINPISIENAKENQRLNKIKNAKFMVMDIQNADLNGLPKPDSIILDPPRKGCTTETLNWIGENKIPQILYISCNPETLARDLEKLNQFGYQIDEVTPLDMFPHTIHVESIVKLTHVL